MDAQMAGQIKIATSPIRSCKPIAESQKLSDLKPC